MWCGGGGGGAADAAAAPADSALRRCTNRTNEKFPFRRHCSY